jgi:hypothetical protein
MAVPRPVLFVLVGLALVVAAFLATRNGQGESVTPPAKTDSPGLKATDPAKPAPSGDPSKSPARHAQPGKPQQPAAGKPQPKSTVPPVVDRAAAALARDDVVVLFFTNPGAADDTQARLSVEAIEDMKGVSFFRASVEQLAAFRPMLDSPSGSIGISQIPATVIVRPGRKAVLLQGFVDPGTLRQNVADALR